MTRSRWGGWALGGAGISIIALLLAHGGLLAGILGALHDLTRLGPEEIALVLGFSLASLLLNGMLWTRVLARLGHRVPPTVGLSTFLSAGLAGCLMNAAGSAIGCTVRLRRYGVCPARAVLISLIGNALGFSGLLIWAPAGLVLLARARMDARLPLLGHSGPAMAAALLAGLVVAMLVVLRALAAAPHASDALAARLLGRHAEPLRRSSEALGAPRLRTRHLLALVPLSSLACFTGMLSLYVVLGALNPGRDLSVGDVVGSVALAATLGSLAVFVPDGMGVRDGALIALLAHTSGAPVGSCAAAALIMRGLDPALKLGLLLALMGAARTPLRQLAPRWSARPARSRGTDGVPSMPGLAGMRAPRAHLLMEGE